VGVKRMKISHLVISVILALCLVVSAGCEIIPEIQETGTTSPPVVRETTPINPEWEPVSQTRPAAALPSIADVVAKVKPSVVAISTEIVSLDFFNRPFTQPSGGSGWIISKDGIIVTNSHVVEMAKSITVILDDGRTFEVDMNTVAYDRLSDMAVMKIDAENLPAAVVGDSDQLRIGDWVVAIGNALGEGTSATSGIVSRRDVELAVSEGQELRDLIQTDAAINPGNSGGPLVNMAGEVIGINTIKIADVNVEGVGMAISTKVAMPLITQLITNGYVVRPWLGLGLFTVNQFVVLRYGLAVTEGVLITEVADNSPASKAGLKPGDVIVEFGDTKITNVSELTRAIHQGKVGDEVTIVFWQEDSRKTAKVVLAESPPP
jgi:S1-C subfamily serine protease